MKENRDEHIRESINKIEPAEGAKERMLANIKRKAAEQVIAENAESKPEKAKILPFRRIMKLVMPVAACFVLAVIGVTVMPNIIHSPESSNPGDHIEIPNSFMSINSAVEFENILGISIDAPDGAENVGYSIIDNELADIVFDFEGHSYNIRASKLSGDFSGLNGIEAKTEQIDAKNNAVLTVTHSGDEFYRKVSWGDGKITFILSNTDGASEDEIKAVYEKIK